MSNQINDIHDLKEPLTISFNFLPLIIFFSILLILIIILTYLSIKKGKNIEIINTKENLNYKLTPKNLALAELEAIRKEQLIENHKVDIFYNRITSLLKNFLFQEYQIKSESRTSHELIKYIKDIKVKDDFIYQLEICLKNLDLKKYSKNIIDKNEMEKSFEFIFTLIDLN